MLTQLVKRPFVKGLLSDFDKKKALAKYSSQSRCQNFGTLELYSSIQRSAVAVAALDGVGGVLTELRSAWWMVAAVWPQQCTVMSHSLSLLLVTGPLPALLPTNTNTCCSYHYTAISSCFCSVHSPLVSTAIILSYDPTKVSDFNLDSVKINNRWFHLVLVQQWGYKYSSWKLKHAFVSLSGSKC